MNHNSIPGNLAPDLVRRGIAASWAGPLWHPVLVTSVRTLTGEQTAYVLDGEKPQRCDFADIVIDLDDADARDRVIRWAADGGGSDPTPRPPHDLGWMRDGAVISASVSVQLLAESVRRIVAGEKPARGLLRDWSPWSNLECVRHREAPNRQQPRDPPMMGLLRFSRGWMFEASTSEAMAHGPENGDEGKRLADAAALLAGYALLDGDVVRVGGPTP